MNKLLLTGTIIAALTTSCVAQPRAPWIVNHNGSIMQVLENNGNIDIIYTQPRPGMWGYVTPGTALVHGAWVDGIIQGTAYYFSKSCGAIPYSVSGGIDPRGILTLVGPTPRLDHACRPVGMDWGVNSRLVFYPG
jgi:hypothetical protein